MPRYQPADSLAVALAFGLSALLAIALTISSVPLSTWDRRVCRQLAPDATIADAGAAPAVPAVVDAARHDDEALLTPHE